ncbi:MAG: V-type ATPase subunit [Oscillospiraceae bacterium]|nr:V-type ATPase subunit [Oscillospiraceae bacterium]
MENKASVKNAPATVAKIKAIHGKRLTEDNISELLNCRSVPEAAEYLKNTERYGEVLSSVDTNTVHRGMLEALLRKAAFMSYIRITAFERLNKQEFYNFRILRAEMEELLDCIRYMKAGSKAHIQTVPVYMNGYTSFDLIGLAQVHDYNRLLEFTEKTPYHNLLKFFEPDKRENIDYTGCEARLRKYYFERLIGSAEGFSKEVSSSLTEFIGVQTDLINIINSFRMIKYFNAEADTIHRLMMPVSHLSADTLEGLYSSQNSIEFLKRLEKTYYGSLLQANGLDALEPEAAALRLMCRNYKRALSSTQAVPVAVYAFTHVMETEVSDIIRIIEGIRYQIPKNDIEKLLIMF